MDKTNKQQAFAPSIAIIILNWNGYTDTIACLESLAHCNYPNFEIILVDNASVDNSITIIKEHITEYNCHATAKKFKITESNQTHASTPEFIPLTFIENDENYGFAKGNNIGIAHAKKHQPNYMLLLNNDTTVDPDFLIELVNFFHQNPEYTVATPQIRYYDKPERIWNCGGKLTRLGGRKYFFDDKHYSELPDTEFIHISFVTGCALVVKSEEFEQHGVLSEAFFFGEEDYEFSMRMKKNNSKAACVLPSLIYHKVNSSISKASDSAIGKIYIHYLNRFIDMRTYMNAFYWHLWRLAYLIYIFVLLRGKQKIKCRTIMRFNKSLLNNSKTRNGVDKQTFEMYINHNFES
ncbi:MAG: glycosyltransferase family 2 protein [Bacteroidota bacterium]